MTVGVRGRPGDCVLARVVRGNSTAIDSAQVLAPPPTKRQHVKGRHLCPDHALLIPVQV